MNFSLNFSFETFMRLMTPIIIKYFVFNGCRSKVEGPFLDAAGALQQTHKNDLDLLAHLVETV